MPDAARVSDATGHGNPLNPGIGSPDVKISMMPAWRAVPASVAAAVDALSNSMKSFMDKPQMTPADAAADLATISQNLAEAGGKGSAAGAPGAAAAASGGAAGITTANTALTTTWTTASAAPGGQPAANVAYTEGIKAAAAAAASAVMAAIAALADTHLCPVPSGPIPHGPGMVTKGSGTVLINNLPACRKGDKVMEACGGSDPIAVGDPTVQIGDEGGSGTSGGGGGAGGGDPGDGGGDTAADPADAADTAEGMQSAAESGAALVPTHVDVTKPSTELATIEFRVINDDDGQPRAGVTLEVRGPDGKLYRPTTGSDGRAVLTNVPDGAYEIIETREVPTLEMVRMESGPRPPR